jgi:polyisoprenoid-binding protein YceI
MTLRRSSLTALGFALGLGLCAVAPIAAIRQDAAASPLRLGSSRVALAGTSNIHEYTASTTAARIVRLQVASGSLGDNVWEEVLKPGVLQAFEIAIPAATLSSPKDGLDKNMHKALNVTAHPDITFRLSRLESGAGPGAVRATGVLQINGVERTITLDLKTQRSESTLMVTGEAQLLMTDFGITPPKAMLGMLKTDPKVTVTFETVLAIPLM